MREMVLNHVSVVADDRHTAVDSLTDVISGMSELVAARVVTSILRMSRPEHEIKCVGDWTLFEAYQELRRIGERDAYLFVIGLGSKVPLIDDLGADIKDRFLRCGEKSLPSSDGEPLVLCAITDWVAVGFPSDPAWDGDQITVTFEELLSHGDLCEAEKIDNLSRQKHASPICNRHRERVLRGLVDFKDAGVLWESRGEAFPDLLFGPDVEGQLMDLNTGHLGTVVNRLASLDSSARVWQETGGPLPPWESLVTNESTTVRNDPRLSERRRFRSRDGTNQMFMWHARYGSGGRIHLRFDAESRTVEIGYIGSHLPTRRS